MTPAPHLRAAIAVLLGLGAHCAAAVAPRSSLPACASSPRSAVRFERAPGGSPEVDASWLAARRCDVRVVDVREPEELSGPLGVIDVAVSVPLATVERAAESWDREAPLVVVCRSGRRSERALETLRSMGFRHVASLTGGMLAWASRALPVTRRGPPPSPTTAASTPSPTPPAQDPLAHALARPDALVWTRVATLLGGNTLSCIDGRAETPLLGAPGGDAGEFVLSLGALERHLGRAVGPAWIASVFERYVAAFGRFYLHTDRHAMERLREVLRRDARFASHHAALADLDGVEAFVRAPPPELEDALLDVMLRPEHVGCGHLRLAMESPERYGIRDGLVADVLRATFHEAWRRPELVDFVVLEGEHAERGVIEVHLDAPTVHAHTLVPMVAPHEDTAAYFVVHPQVMGFVREENAHFFVEQLDDADQRLVDTEALHAHIERLGAQQLAATVSRLASSLPRRVVHVATRAQRVVRVETAR